MDDFRDEDELDDPELGPSLPVEEEDAPLGVEEEDEYPEDDEDEESELEENGFHVEEEGGVL